MHRIAKIETKSRTHTHRQAHKGHTHILFAGKTFGGAYLGAT